MIESLGRDMRYAKRIPYIPVGAKTALTIQVGSFRDRANAKRFKKGLSFKYDNVHLSRVILKGKTYHRVRVGKYDNYENAYQDAEKLSDEGYSALIMKRD